MAALKVMHSSHLHSPQEEERFFREAEILASLSHPHILLIYYFGVDEEEGLPYLVVEYAPNGSLRDLLKSHAQNPMPITQSLSIITQIGEALFYAHQKHFVHCDVKPENIMFNANGEVLLCDFSIAVEQHSMHIEEAIDVIGTPSYMAPEQFDGYVTRLSDQYALGCMSYELLTGHKPFQAPDPVILMQKHKYENPIPPTQLNPQIPQYIEQVVLKAMAKNSFDRYENVSQFINALQGLSPSPAFDNTVPKTSQMDKWQWLAEGTKLRKLQRYEAALEADGQALLIDPNFSIAYHNKGISLHKLKRHEAALEMYEHAIALDPQFASAYKNKAHTLLELKRFQEALKAFEKAILLDPTNADAYYGKSHAFYKLSQYNEALQACKNAIRLDPKFAPAYHDMGILLMHFGRYQEALKVLDTAIQTDAHQPAFYYTRANILQKMGRVEEAEQAYQMGNQLEKQ
jgi:serine/threonine protein kinase